MGSEFSPEKIQRMKDEAQESMKEVISELQQDAPKVVDAVAATVGSTLGGGALFTARHFGGSVDLSGAGKVVVAVGVVLGTIWYVITTKRRHAKEVAALNRAIEKLYAIQERLMENAEHYRELLAELKAWIDELERRIP